MGGAGQTGEGWCREPPWSGRLSRLERRSFQALPSLRRRPSGPPGFAFPSLPFLPGISGGTHWGPPIIGSRRKEKRSLQVLQDRCDNPQSPGRVGGEREEAGCANGKIGWGLVQRTHAPPAFHPAPRLSRLPPPSQPSPISVPVWRISWGYCSCLKKSPSVSKRAATSLVLSKPLPAFRLL